MRITAVEFHVVPVSPRGDWLFVRLLSSLGLDGWGEASHGCGFTRASAADNQRMRALVEKYFGFVRGASPFAVESFRGGAWERAKAEGLPAVTAFSAIEQAMWDLAGQAAGIPAYAFFGGRLRETVPVYANINRATNRRTPEDFAQNAGRAVAAGFRAVKAAVFDDFSCDAEPGDRQAKLDLGVERLTAMRDAIGDEVDLLVDCHSRFQLDLSTTDLAVEVAQRLEPLRLGWYEEPIDPARVDETAAIKDRIAQRLAGGELLFGREGFEPLCRRRAVDVIMPDVKHCGGALELKKIAALAETYGVEVSPHSPSGPVSTAAGAHIAATLPNFQRLEHAWGEADWRADLLSPPERFEQGELVLSERPGWGFDFNPQR